MYENRVRRAWRDKPATQDKVLYPSQARQVYSALVCERVRELTGRSCGLSIGKVIARLNQFTKGWWNDYRHADVAAGFRSINYWVRRRLRAIIWKHWKNPRTRVKGLKKRGIYHLDALLTGCSRKGAWRMSKVKWVVIAMQDAYFDQLGLFLP